MPDTKQVSVNISTISIVKTLLIILFLLFLYIIKDVIGIIIVSVVFAAAINPWIDRMKQAKIPRPLSIILIYLVLFGILVLSIILLIPPITDQVKAIAQNFPDIYNKVASSFMSVQEISGEYGLVSNIQEGLNTFSQDLTRITGGVFSAIAGIFGSIIATLGVLVITFYLTVDKQGFKKFVNSAAPLRYQPYLIQKLNRVQEKMGGWLRGKLILCIIVGVMTLIGLYLIGMGEYALVLAFLAGIAEFIPYIGPIVSAIPAVLLGFSISPWTAILAAVLYFVIQQLENSLISPKIMQRSVGMNPVLVIIVMLIGAKVAGLIGILLSVPIAIIIWVFVEDFFTEKKLAENRLEKAEENGKAKKA